MSLILLFSLLFNSCCTKCPRVFLFVCVSFGIDVSDRTRIAAQVVSGIGFLGAGVILRDGSKIKGFT